MENPDVDKKDGDLSTVMDLLHKFLFALENTESNQNHDPKLFCSHVSDYLELLDKDGKELMKNNIPKEAIEKFVEFSNKSPYFDSVTSEDAEGKGIKLNIIGCVFAKNKDTHRLMNSGKDYCPMAMIAAAIIRHSKTNPNVELKPTNFTKYDSETIIEISQ